jgi:hypothetical protein
MQAVQYVHVHTLFHYMQMHQCSFVYGWHCLLEALRWPWALQTKLMHAVSHVQVYACMFTLVRETGTYLNVRKSLQDFHLYKCFRGWFTV